MSERPTNWVIGHSEAKNALRLVLTILAVNAADEDGNGRIRIVTVARSTGLDSNSAEKALKLLAETGFIELGAREIHRSYPYRVVIPENYGHRTEKREALLHVVGSR